MNKLVIGTAQLGLNYGITNISGKPDSNQSQSIVYCAINNGINTFDTAREYGNAEEILSHIDKYHKTTIITKLSKFDINLSREKIIQNMNKSINQSCIHLNTNSLQVLLTHTYEHYRNKIIWQKLIELQKKGKINKLGVSIYNVNEAIDILQDKTVEHIQLPVNIIDSQWNNETFLNLVKKRKDVTIHIRSIYLQGILLNNKNFWPKDCNADFYTNNLENLKQQLYFSSKIELCLSYVKSLKWVDGIVIGVETLEQLQENIKLYNRTRKLTDDEIDIIHTTFNNTSKILTDPRLWIK